jgi:hypothetical protein
MNRIVLMLACLSLTGCMSVQRDGFKLSAWGQDLNGTLEYARIGSNGVVEVFTFAGTKNASESTHTVANLIGAVAGAAVGTAINPGAGTTAGAVKGAAVGGATAEVWQTVKDWLSKKGKDIAGVSVPVSGAGK